MAEDTILRNRSLARATAVAASPEPTAISTPVFEADLPLPAAAKDVVNQWWDYVADFTQRWTLFVDILRQRANNMLVHEEAGLPPLLHFDYEMLLDGRAFERPANYA